MKRFILLLVIVSIPVIFALGQASEMSIEESYLQESIENMIIREQSRAESREMKMIALSYIGDAIERGNRGDEVRQALEYMGLEGILNRGRENGRLVNNYPDVRRESARYLGLMGTPEAKDALLRIIYYDNEPMVLQEAIKSLGDIGIDDDGRAMTTIAWIFQKFDNTNPDNLLALSAIEAFEKLSVKGMKDTNAIQILIRIAEGPYIRPVQDRARQALVNLRRIQAEHQQTQQQEAQRR
ncbi:MAG: HEAT repeat domain-containing protein [Treponema sp.]|nr:HEAT repeat domain-containing protein [Treponema sp.]